MSDGKSETKKKPTRTWAEAAKAVSILAFLCLIMANTALARFKRVDLPNLRF